MWRAGKNMNVCGREKESEEEVCISERREFEEGRKSVFKEGRN